MIDSATLKKCHDKGISVGEKSNLIANNVFINKAKVGIASKIFQM